MTARTARRTGRWFVVGLALTAASFAATNVVAADSAAANNSVGQFEPPNRGSWPAGLRDVPLERLSSGALLRLDAGGDLVETPAAHASRTHAPEIASALPDAVAATDPRIGNNVRLGDDPPALPDNQRAQAEPHIVRSPINANYLLATFQEGRFPDGSAVNCGYSVSRDGGFTWTRALIPGLTPSSGGAYPRATDPVAAVALNGHSYLNTLSAGSSTSGGTILVNRSTDGTNFEPPVVAFQAASPSDFPDKNWIAINNFPGTFSTGRIVVTFTMFAASGGGANGGAPHPIRRVYSDDGGQSWSSADLIHSGARQVQGSQPLFLPDGRLVVIYWNFNGSSTPADDFIEMVVSPDGGVTFGPPQFVTSVNYYNAPSVRDGGFLPSATVDGSGKIFISYQAIHNGAPRIMFIRSPDAGTTWTAPVPISDNPASSGVFNAAISTSPDGQRLAVVFYDHRNNPGSTTLLDLYAAMSFDGGNTWQPNTRVSSVSSNAALAPLTINNGGYMLGDYQGIAESTNPAVPAVPVWIDTRTGNPDPFTARVVVARVADAKAEFTGDAHADIIWQNNVTGDRGIWLMNDTTLSVTRFLPRIPLEWEIAATGDFNGDSQSDIVWQNKVTGARGIWLMNGSTWAGERFLPTILLEWQIAGAADFNGDGHTDILWQNSANGQRGIWLMKGTAWAGERFLPVIPLEWQIAGTGDFNQDRQPDIIWQNTTTGQRGIWLMNGTSWAGERFLPTVPLEWQIAGAGDFDRNGHSDLLWQNTHTGERGFWLMDGTTLVAVRFLPTVALEWEIKNR